MKKMTFFMLTLKEKDKEFEREEKRITKVGKASSEVYLNHWGSIEMSEETINQKEHECEEKE